MTVSPRRGHRRRVSRPARRSPSGPAGSGRTSSSSTSVSTRNCTAGNPEKSARVRVPTGGRTTAGRPCTSAHVAAWDALWRSDIVLPDQPDLQRWVRAGLYGLLSNVRPGEDDSISPVGLTSDNYAGLIFWDAETWMYPGLLLTHPEIAKSIVEYRYRTVPGARANAKRVGYDGPVLPLEQRAARATWGRSATASTHRTASPRSTCRATSPWRCGSTTWPPATRPGCVAAAGRCSRASPSSGPAGSPRNARRQLLRSRTSPARTSTATASTTASTPTPSPPPHYATRPRPPRCSARSAPAAWKTIADKLRMPFDQKQQVFLQYDGYTGSLSSRPTRCC